MKSWSIPLGRVMGAEFRIHLVFLFLVMFILFTSLDGKDAAGVDHAFILVGIIFVAVLLHELGHLLAANVRGIKPRLVMLLPIGGISIHETTENDTPPPAKDEILVALAGPMTSILVGAVCALLVSVMRQDLNLFARPFITTVDPLKSLVWVNVFLGGLNLIPAYPLDGGRILRALLYHSDDRTMDYRGITRRVVNMGQVFATFLIFAGIWNTWLMLVGFFLFVAVQIEDRTLLFHSVIESVRLEEIMLTDFSTLSPADTLQDALDKAVHSLQDDFPVIRGADMVGVISKQNILTALRDDGNGYVQSAMNKVFEIGQRSDSLAAAFRKITNHDSTIIPVVDNDRLVGIVTLQNLMHSMGVLAETRKLQRDEED